MISRATSYLAYPLPGITGLTTAFALGKLPNVDVQIYERATELRELGQVIALNPNGLRTLEKLGLHRLLSDDLGYKCPSGIPQTLRCVRAPSRDREMLMMTDTGRRTRRWEENNIQHMSKKSIKWLGTIVPIYKKRYYSICPEKSYT